MKERFLFLKSLVGNSRCQAVVRLTRTTPSLTLKKTVSLHIFPPPFRPSGDESTIGLIAFPTPLFFLQPKPRVLISPSEQITKLQFLQKPGWLQQHHIGMSNPPLPPARQSCPDKSGIFVLLDRPFSSSSTGVLLFAYFFATALSFSLSFSR